MKVILTLITICILFGVHAQSTQFWNHYAHFNPATSGLEYKHQAAVTYRDLWIGYEYAPKMLYANYNTRIGEHHGLGVNYSNYTLSFMSTNDVNINYNYQIHFDSTKAHLLSFGIGLGITNTAIDGALIYPMEDEKWDLKYRSTNPNINLGAAYKIADFFVGIGVTHLTEGVFTNTFYTPTRLYYLMGSYDLHLSQKISLKPQFQLQTDLINIFANLNLMAMIREQFWFGVGYRSNNALIGMIGWDIKKKIRIGYAYDQTFYPNYNTSRGSHEIVLGLMIK